MGVCAGVPPHAPPFHFARPRAPRGIMGRMETTTRTKLETFAVQWADLAKGREKQDTAPFWTTLLTIINGWDTLETSRHIRFEHPVNGGYIDMLCPDARLLVEQKSRGIDLDRPEPRRGTPVTPVQQALRYANDLPASTKPRYLCTCNFDTFRLYDLDADPTATTPTIRFTLTELPVRAGIIRQIFSPDNSRIHIQEQVSRKAGILVARIHNELAAQYHDPDEPAAHHALSVLTVRLVFLMYAQDAGLLPHPDMFSDYVESFDTAHLRRALLDLLDTLDTPPHARDPYLEEQLAAFPYMDGGLFAGKVAIPPFTEGIRDALIDAARGFDWSRVSPVVFGSLMEETLSHDQRRAGGMHYTTVRNIHRVIGPLFLNRLSDELDQLIRDSNERMEREEHHRGRTGEYVRYRRRGRTLDPSGALHQYRERLGRLHVADFAAGSGNFLTETYLRLRELENRALDAELGGQGTLMADDDLVKVRIDHFHGMEVNDFACAVARTALWIAQQQSLDDTEAVAGRAVGRLPLEDSGNIMCADALRADWDGLLPGDECDYVIGNPPFVGQYLMGDSQREDMRNVWGKDYDGYLDYATAWFRKASRYLTRPDSGFALVATNSITQGQPVPSLFRPLFGEGWRIRFAHRTFAWDAQSTDMAHVHVVIVGMDRGSDVDAPPVLFDYDDPFGEPSARVASHINGYLIDGPDVWVGKRMTPLSPELAPAVKGSQPTDGGHLTFADTVTRDAMMSDPDAAPHVRGFVGARELINGTSRWCLWLEGAEPSVLRRSPLLRARVEGVRAMRLASRKEATRMAADTPWLFAERRQPDEPCLCVPRHFSAGREYMTCGRLGRDIIVGDSCFSIADPDGLAFAIIESRMFMAWQDAVGGRIKSDCRFSNTVVWNNLPLPCLSDDMRAVVIEAGGEVLAARAAHAGQSLADLYSPGYMPSDLRAAHRRLDRVVDVAFGADGPCGGDDGRRLRVLFRAWAALSGRG